MRAVDKTQALFFGTLAVGAGVLAIAAIEGASRPLAMLALLGAAAVVTELIEVPSDEHSLDPADAHPFSFSSTVHLATVMVMGGASGALVAAFGVIVVDTLRGSRWRQVAYNASVFALATAAAGLAFEALGATPGELRLPGDFDSLGALALIYYVINTLFVSAIIAFGDGARVGPVARQTFWHGLPSTAGEAALAYALARRALNEPWAIVALVPLVFAVYYAHARLAALRRETARALETFANVVDERDPSTFHHSARVSEHVRRLAQGLRLPASDVARLRWAARLHDLGKIGVDSSVLQKPGLLGGDDWAAIRRHPRISARLLRRFRFASSEARAVEYHHERYDGTGYYNVEPSEIPLAAHFLIVADTFDAMTSDRPYRAGLPRDVALAEIEAGAGTQFHPAVARAFVALERGVDPLAVLTPAETAGLRRLSLSRVSTPSHVVLWVDRHPEVLVSLGLAGALAAIALGRPWLALGALLAAVAITAWWQVQRVRARLLADDLRRALAEAPGEDLAFAELTGRLARVSPLSWAGLVAWQERDLAGSIAREWGDRATRPPETALTSWLIREAEAAEDVATAPGSDIGTVGHTLCVPLRRDGSLSGSLSGYVVFVFDPQLPRHVELALRACVGDLAGSLDVPAGPAESRGRPRHLAAVG